MSPWPGAPKSQQSPKINVPSVRFPNTLNENSSTGEIVQALRTAFNGLTVHEQAFANLPAQIKTQAMAAASTLIENIASENIGTVVTAFNTRSGFVLYFPGLGGVNNQLGNAAYETQMGDAGQKIIVGDSSPVTVTLNPTIMPPWFTFIGNDSTSGVTLVPGSPAHLVGVNFIYPGGFALVYYDGQTFWSEGVAIATDSSLGVVQPDNVTIDSDSGVISTIGASGTIHLAALTGGGTQGSIIVLDGLIQSFVNPT